jgi:hypothetical protein
MGSLGGQSASPLHRLTHARRKQLAGEREEFERMVQATSPIGTEMSPRDVEGELFPGTTALSPRADGENRRHLAIRPRCAGGNAQMAPATVSTSFAGQRTSFRQSSSSRSAFSLDLHKAPLNR